MRKNFNTRQCKVGMQETHIHMTGRLAATRVRAGQMRLNGDVWDESI